jgi:serine/threonine protein kinase
MDFLSKCLRYDPEQRISIDHAMNHPFINPDSPQYMDKICLRPMIQVSKSIANVTTSNTMVANC